MIKTNQLTEEQLIKACIRKDAACEKELFMRYGSRMLGVCNRYARNTADAEDILQDAFIKVFDKIQQFKFEGSFEGWIRKIVVNTALKKYSVQRYEKEVSGYEIKDRDEMITDPGIYSHLTHKELLEMIKKLPDGYRVIFNLYVIEGYQHDEIAEMLGIQPGTSRSQLVKARAMLQKQIAELQKIAV
ncbi:MAG TPA: RNA polymerase sigma factor [Ferruginibacter sp.]|nr:RNA polymerase sigma factor [Ferruginibacter sp.]HMP19736.1 RNA polymerase sigma factor [Ferruginibacter sp.]